MSVVDEVTEQLIDELGPIARAVGDLLGTDALMQAELNSEARCQQLALEVCSGDERTSAEAVLTIMTVRWPEGTTPPPEWWNTPVGRCCARSFAPDAAETVSRSVAAAMLGVGDGTVAQLVHRGALDQGHNGHITTSSVLARIAKLGETGG